MRISLEDFEKVESNLTVFQIFSMQNNSSYLSHHLVASCFELLEFELNLETRGVCCVRWRFGTRQSYLPLLSNRLWPFINKKWTWKTPTRPWMSQEFTGFLLLCSAYRILFACNYLTNQELARSCRLPLHHLCACVLSWFSHVWLSETLWTVALSPWDSSGMNTGVGCQVVLQIFPTQRSNTRLLHWLVGSLPLAPPGKPLHHLPLFSSKPWSVF